MSSFASDEEKQEVLRRMARRYAHLKNRPMPDHIADGRRKRPETVDDPVTN